MSLTSSETESAVVPGEDATPPVEGWLGQVLQSLPPRAPQKHRPTSAGEAEGFPIVAAPLDAALSEPMPIRDPPLALRSGETLVAGFADALDLARHWPRLVLLAQLEGQDAAATLRVEARPGVDASLPSAASGMTA